MTDLPLIFRIALWTELALVPITLLLLFVVTAPYGRHSRTGWGPRISSRWGWILMEGTSLLIFCITFFFGRQRFDLAPLILLAAWAAHYGYRAAVYPQLTRSGGHSMPLLIAASGVLFNVLNAWLNARWVSQHGSYPPSWILDPRMLAGLTLMACGFLLHVHSDAILIRLRKPGENHYVIPQGGLHRWVCNPNYLGEIIEWFGWALATWSLPGLAFALFTVANLLPRAVANRRWYRDTFEHYPRHRKALIPGVF